MQEATISTQIPALVINASHLTALGVVRQLGSEGVPVDGLFLGSGNRFSQGWMVEASRYWRRQQFRPDAVSDEDVVGALLELAPTYSEPPALIPVDDASMLAVSRNREQLRQAYRFHLAPAATVERVVFKHLFYPAAQMRGLRVPESYSPKDPGDVREVSRQIRYPCVIKPSLRSSDWARLYGSHKVVFCEDSTQLLSAFEQIAGRVPGRLLVQEVVEGVDDSLECGFIYLDEHGQCLCQFQCRKLRQFPPLFGDTSMAQSQNREDVFAETMRVARALELTGYVGVEFKREAGTGRLIIIEVTLNRLDGQAVMAILSGVNIPGVCYRQLVGQAGAEAAMDPSPVRWISECNELRCVPWYLWSGRIGPVELVRSFRGVGGAEVFSAGDLKPTVRLLVSLPLVAARTLRRKIAPRNANLGV